MELSMSSGALRTFTRCVTCLARVGSDLVLQAHPTKRVQPMQMDHLEEPPEIVSDNPHSQHRPSNWVCADEDADDDEDEELFVQTTPHHMD